MSAAIIDGATRRWVERHVMSLLAGGLVTMRATGRAIYEETVADQLLADLSEASGELAGG